MTRAHSVRGEARLCFWQVLTALSLSICVLTGHRLWAFERASPGKHPSNLAAAVSEADQPTLLVPAAAIPLTSDWVLAQLKLSESAQEVCDLLKRMSPSEDVAQTYSITDVLDRTRFRSERACLAAALAAEPTAPAQTWLLDLANDPEPSVHTVALGALAKRDDGLAHATVVDAAYSVDPALRVAAVNALLSAGQNEPLRNTRRGAAFDLAKGLLLTIDEPGALADLTDALGASRDPRALPVLKELLANAGQILHLRAIAAVGALGRSEGAELVEPYLRLGSEAEFSEAAKALSVLSAATAERDLKMLLHAGNARRRFLALAKLSELDTPGLRAILLEAAEGDDPELASVAIGRLSELRDETLVFLFARAARGGTLEVRRVAFRALVSLGTPEANGELRSLAAGSGRVAEMAVDAMLQVPELRAEAQRLRSADLQSFSPNKRFNALRMLALDSSPAGRAALVDYLSTNRGDSKNWGLVMNALPLSDLAKLVPSASDPSSRQEFFAALAARSDPESLDLLRSATGDQDETTRRSAIQGLVNLGADGSDDLLKGLVKSSSSDDRRLAAELLATQIGSGSATTGALANLAGDPDAEVATASIGALKDRAPEEAARLVERAMRSGTTESRQVLLGAMSGWNRELALPILESGLRDPDSTTASSAIDALSAFEGPDVARLLYSVVVDSGRSAEVRAQAAAALQTLGGPLVRSNQALIESLLTPATETYVRQYFAGTSSALQ